MRHKSYNVLYFITGPSPTEEQRLDAAKFGPHCKFRNAIYHTPGSGLEPCTAVTGDVPADYADEFPAAVSYIAWLQGELVEKERAPAISEAGLGVRGGSFADRVIGEDGSKPLGGFAGTGGEMILPPPPPPGKKASAGSAGAPPPPPADWKPQAA